MRKCRRVTEIKTLLIMLYDEMAHIVVIVIYAWGA